MSHEQAVRCAKKLKCNPKFIEFLVASKKFFDTVYNDPKNLGFALTNDEQNLVLILKKPKDVWEYLECLVHEVSHIVDWIVEYASLEGETEARAYLTEWLFRNIRRKLLP